MLAHLNCIKELRWVIAASIGSVSAIIALSANATTVSVTSGGSTVEVEIFTAGGAVSDFYSISTSDKTLANTPIGLEYSNSNAAVFLLVEGADTTPGTVALGFTIDAPRDGSDGSAAMSLSGFTSPPTIEVSGDGSETIFDTVSNTLNDNYTEFRCCTDGFLVSGIELDILRLSFEITNATGLANGLFFATPSGSSGADLSGISSSGTIDDPLPPVMALLVVGFAGLGLLTRR